MNHDVNWHELVEKLSAPFPAKLIQWRAGAVSRDRKRAQALPYVDPRDYEKRLDEACPGNWSVNFEPWGEHRIICRLTLYGITRSSTGEENDGFAPGTAAEAQAFKRACSKFGLGRYLYEYRIPWVAFDDSKKQLSEVPSLGDLFLPTKPTRSTVKTVTPPQAPLKAGEHTLTRERAEAMHRELGRIGYKREQHYSLAQEVIKRPVKSLTTITLDEAARVWGHAMKEANHQKSGGGDKNSTQAALN